MAAFLEIRLFDAQLLVGTSGGPRWSTQVVSMASGAEKRNVQWARQRAHYDIGGRLVDEQELSEIVEHFNAVQGMAIGFRWRDLADHHVSASSSVLVPVGGLVYQLHKAYRAGGMQRLRKISKPVSDSFSFYINGVEQGASTFGLDETTGLLTLHAAPAVGAALTFVCDFDIPVRFDTDALEYTYQGGVPGEAVYDLASLPVVELKL